MQDIILDEKQELENIESDYIYEMKINDSVAIGLLKENLINILYSKEKCRDEFDKLVQFIRKNIVPIRPGRHFKRPAKNKMTKEMKKEYRAKKKQLRENKK